jgi:CheY-like chemotaxis protein
MVTLDESFGRLHNMKPGPAVRVVVQDDGPGMPAEVLGRAFEPFFTTKAIGEGSGLGLSMVEAICGRHRGAVIADSAPDQGARFELYFPVDQPLSPAPATKSEEKALPEPKRNLRAQVICVDDEPAVLKTFELIIAHAGHDVTLFASSTDALEWLRANPHVADLVITDQTMPDLSGLELADQLCELSPALPVILVSGYTDVGIDEAPRPNIRLNLCKPVGYDALLNAVAECLAPRFKPTTSA